MKHSIWLLVLALSWITCTKEDLSAEEKKLIGNWSGLFTQPGYPNFTGTFSITKLKIGDEAATGQYSNPSCNVTWTYQKENISTFQFKENIEGGSDANCAPGTVVLGFVDDDHLSYFWTGDDSPTNTAQGTLTRQ